MMRLPEADGYIFDLDGTLLDSNGVWEQIDRDVLERNGIFLTDREIKNAASMTYEEVLGFFCSKGIKYTLEELKDEFDRMAIKAYSETVMLKAGAGEYLKTLKLGGKRIALATASPERLYAPALRRCGSYGLFDAFCTADESGRSKDHPDIYLLAAKKLEVKPERCMVFEDIPAGILSAKKAGMYAAAVYDGYCPAEERYMRSIADIYITSFEELLP